MPTVAVDKEDLYERLGKVYSQSLLHRVPQRSLNIGFRPQQPRSSISFASTLALNWMKM